VEFVSHGLERAFMRVGIETLAAALRRRSAIAARCSSEISRRWKEFEPSRYGQSAHATATHWHFVRPLGATVEATRPDDLQRCSAVDAGLLVFRERDLVWVAPDQFAAVDIEWRHFEQDRPSLVTIGSRPSVGGFVLAIARVQGEFGLKGENVRSLTAAQRRLAF